MSCRKTDTAVVPPRPAIMSDGHCAAVPQATTVDGQFGTRTLACGRALSGRRVHCHDHVCPEPSQDVVRLEAEGGLLGTRRARYLRREPINDGFQNNEVPPEPVTRTRHLASSTAWIPACRRGTCRFLVLDASCWPAALLHRGLVESGVR